MQTILAAATTLRNRTQTPIDLLEGCLERIDRLESRARAWVFVDRESSRADAERMTAELRAGHSRGPLHGIPLGVKDIIDVADWPTAAGSKRWAQSIARHDAPVVERLRQAGAVLIGKTVTTQFASFDPPPTRNPWNWDQTPGGSSSGSAVAVACGMCFGALGTQTGGSITRPASFCGVPSCKPTYGRSATTGVVPLAPSMDHIGPMARHVSDLAVLLQVIAEAGTHAVPDYVASLALPRPPRIGRIHGLFDELATPTVRAATDEACAMLRRQGATVLDIGLPAAFAEVLVRHRVIMGVEAAAFHGTRYRRHPEDYQPRIRSLVEEGFTYSGSEYALTREHQRQLSAAMLGCFESVDALVAPATTTPAPSAETTGNPAFNSPWSYTGSPTVSVPAAVSPEGLPLSLQFIGKHWDEATLLAVAAWCEERLPPIGEPKGTV
jgi:aspartyl-tRNA(Asn)/glutamyl-tRNA(Gln) amidotransferase subunit A